MRTDVGSRQVTPPPPRASSLRKPPEPKEPPKGSVAKKDPAKEGAGVQKESPKTPPKVVPTGGGARPVTPERGPVPKPTDRSPPPRRRVEDHQSSSSTGVTTPEPMSEKEEAKGKAPSPSRSPLRRKAFGTKQRKQFEKKYGEPRVRFEEPLVRESGEAPRQGSPPKGKSKGKNKGKGKGKMKGKKKGKGKQKGQSGPGKGSKGGGSGGKA